MISIIDYDRGNVFSLQRAFDRINEPHNLIETSDQVADADRLVLPGVGAFGDAMNQLEKRDLTRSICKAARSGTPLLGICLGMQLMCSVSYEFGVHKGLGLIEGTVERLPVGSPMRVPNVGWREIKTKRNSIFTGFTKQAMYYFVHSYGVFLANNTHACASICFNGQEIPVAIQNNNLVGYQFHPEKSGEAGLALLKAFAIA